MAGPPQILSVARRHRDLRWVLNDETEQGLVEGDGDNEAVGARVAAQNTARQKAGPNLVPGVAEEDTAHRPATHRRVEIGEDARTTDVEGFAAGEKSNSSSHGACRKTG